MFYVLICLGVILWKSQCDLVFEKSSINKAVVSRRLRGAPLLFPLLPAAAVPINNQRHQLISSGPSWQWIPSKHAVLGFPSDKYCSNFEQYFLSAFSLWLIPPCPSFFPVPPRVPAAATLPDTASLSLNASHPVTHLREWILCLDSGRSLTH